MQVSLKWLKDYVDFTETAEEIADRLTMAGIPVENIVRADEGLEKVITGRIESITPHPDSDHLLVCQMDMGDASRLQIITGASNVRTGQVVPVAMVGAVLPNGKKISAGKLRGLLSSGMLCSPDELRLADDADDERGIYILPADTPVGKNVAGILGLDDIILEFELTANRADCFSVIGIAREVAALTGKPLKMPAIEVVEAAGEKAGDLIDIKIEDNDLCRRFSGRMLRNVKIAPSPAWIVERLKGAGIRAINNVVDVTNFVMLELGQPLHAYDYDEIQGKMLIARRAEAGENLHTLDDSSRLAVGDELVIADAKNPAGLAGVMGGLETEITDKTTSVVLEAASFKGAGIRRTARSIGIHSEASGRFERGVDITQTVRALNRAAQLLEEMGACTVVSGVVDVYPNPAEQVCVEFTAQAVNDHLGTDIDGEWMAAKLKSIGFEVVEESAGKYKAVVPSWRMDVTLMEDISEEVARLYGYDNITSTMPYGAVLQGHQSEEQNFVDIIKEALVGQGMTEEVSFSFTSEEILNKLNVPSDSEPRHAIPIMNPLTDDYPLIRTTLLSSIMENAARNFARKNTRLRLFDVAPVFLPKNGELPLTDLADERLKLVGLITGRRLPIAWDTNNESVDFYDMKGIVENLFHKIGIQKYKVERGEHFALHPGKTAIIKKGSEIIATLGEVHPTVAENFGISQKVYIFEMDVATLQKYRQTKTRLASLPKYPAIERDLALLVDSDVMASDILAVIKKNGGAYFRDATLFDVYTGKQVAEGKKSMAYHLYFQARDKTLTDAEVDAAFENILEATATELKAELRA